MTALDFRIERHDASGNRLPPVPVQMRGQSFTGSVNNGDEIRVIEGEWRHGTLRVDKLDNLTTGASVRAGRRRGWTIVTVAVLALLSAIAVAIAVAVVRAESVPDEAPEPPSWYCEEGERAAGEPPLGC